MYVPMSVPGAAKSPGSETAAIVGVLKIGKRQVIGDTYVRLINQPDKDLLSLVGDVRLGRPGI